MGRGGGEEGCLLGCVIIRPAFSLQMTLMSCDETSRVMPLPKKKKKPKKKKRKEKSERQICSDFFFARNYCDELTHCVYNYFKYFQNYYRKNEDLANFAKQRFLGDIYKMAMEEDPEDPMLESHRTSLLEVIEDRNRTLNKVFTTPVVDRKDTVFQTRHSK